MHSLINYSTLCTLHNIIYPINIKLSYISPIMYVEYSSNTLCTGLEVYESVCIKQ